MAKYSSQWARFAVGLILLFTAICFAAWGFSQKELYPHQRGIILWILPLASGFSVMAFAGSLTVKAQGVLPGIAITATSGFGVWLITFFYLFPNPDPVVSKEGEIERLLTAMLASIDGNEYDAATQAANEVLKLDADNGRALNGLGTVSFYLGDYHKAAEQFESALTAREKRGERSDATLSNLADTYVELGRYDDAIVIYNRMDTKGADWSYETARAYVYGGQYQKGLDLIKSVSESAYRGRAKVLEAAALAGLAKSMPESNAKQFLSDAKNCLELAVAQDREFWQRVLVNGEREENESYEKTKTLLAPVLSQVL